MKGRNVKLITVVFLALTTTAFSAPNLNHWNITSWEMEGDSVIRVVYRTETGVNTNGFKAKAVVKIKGKNIRVTDTAYKRIDVVPSSESDVSIPVDSIK
jgi:hypothetical protein